MKPVFILVHTQLPENLGAVARALKNFGFGGQDAPLRLVKPLCDPKDPKAFSVSTGAEDILESASLFSNFQEAIFDLPITFGTTASPRHMVKPCVSLEKSIDLESPGKIGWVFGPERTGLTNEQLTLCSYTVQIPTQPEFSSLNISQAVLLVAYTLFAAPKQYGYLSMGETSLAPYHSVQTFLHYLEEQLDEVRYWRVRSKKKRMWQNLRNFFIRAQMTEQDIRTLWGMIESLRYPRNKEGT